MARTALTLQSIIRTGLTATYSNANGTDGNYFSNNGFVFVHAKCGASTGTLTFQTPGTVDGLSISDRTVQISASAEVFIGPFQVATYNRGDDTVYVDISTAST